MSQVLNSGSAAPVGVRDGHRNATDGKTPNNAVLRVELSHMQRWLGWQCKKIPGVIRAAVYAVDSSRGQVGDASRGASWPDAVEDPAALLTLANAALLRKTSIAKSISTQGENARQIDCISVPLPAENPRFVFVVLVGDSAVSQRQALSELIVWGSHWLLEPELHSAEKLQSPVFASLLNRCAAAENLRHLCHELVGELSRRFNAERVSLGLLDRGRVSVKVISGLAEFDPRMHQVACLRLAMQEAMDLDQSISVETGSNTLLYSHHRALLGDRRGAVDTLLLKDAQGALGVLSIEREQAASAPATATSTTPLTAIDQLITAVTPLLRLHQQAERGMAQHLLGSCSATSTRLLTHGLFGRTGTVARTALYAVAVLALVLLVAVPGDYRITSSATIEGSGKQVLVAPFEGFIRAANARAGDTVEEGAIIAELDTGALQVQQGKWKSELDKLEKSYSQALAAGDRAELSLLKALRDELRAELDLVEQRLQRSVLRAPYPGVLVSGDLHQLLGAPVEAGQALFEISSLDKFRLMLDIDEQAVASVKTGQQGSVRLASLPSVKYDIRLKHLQPVATVVDGKNVFRMEAELLNPDASIRPGMTGVAKISAGERSRIWLWTHALVNRLRIWIWSLGFGQ